MPRGKKKITPSSTSDMIDKTVATVSNGSTEIVETVKVTTKEQSERLTLPVIEKSKEAERNNAPVILVSWTDANGKRNTYTFTCAEVRIVTDKSETLQRSGKKTVVNIAIDAQVLEMDHR
jgi:hypothetical protein